MREEEKAQYEATVSAAEKALYIKQAVTNTEIADRQLILCLFRESNITLSRKTKAWIESSLYSVSFDEGRQTWSFKHNGNLDPLFRSFFDQLIIALTRKHGGIQLSGISNEGG
jgi:hypothetical protein